MRVINELKKVYKDLISPEDIFNQNTVGKLAKYIHGRMKSADEETDKFELETMEDKTTFKQLPFNTSDMATKEIKPLETKDLKTKNILITGATGVLGGRLLKEYLETTDSILYCLVRSKDIEEAKERLLTFIKVYDPQLTLLKEFNKRVIPVIGDITEPLLGIELEDYKKLVSVIDMTVNSAGKTSLHGLYDEVKDVNLNGTQNIIKFALETKQKYLIHISTIGIMGDLQLSSNPAYKESDLDLGQGFDNMGYPKSKLEAEKLIHSMSAMGLKWIIIRSGNIMGDSKNGQYPFGITKTPGVFYDYFKTAIDLGLAISSSWYFDITPIDYVSKSIVWFSTCLKNIYETYHLANPNHKTINDIIRLIQEYGYSIKFTNIKEYMKVLNSKENKYHSITTELMLFSPLGTMETEGFTYVDTTYTTSVLAKAGIFCPDIDETLIKVYLDYCVQVEYLKKRAENYSFWGWQKE
jgi:thioester reductase-like protein